MPHLHDMEELVNSIQRKDAKDYMREALSCYMSSAYRGAIVLTFIALFDDILQKLGELGKVNKKAKKLFDDATIKRNDQEVFENYLIDQLKANSLLPSLDVDFLNMLRTLRNKSAHPSGHHASAEEARFVFFESINRFMSKPILSTTQLADEILANLDNENLFPSTNISITAKVVAQELENIHNETYPYLITKLLEKSLSADKVVSKNATYFLEGWARQAKDADLPILQKYAIEKKCTDKDYNKLIIELLSANGKLFAGLDSVTYHRLALILGDEVAAVDLSLEFTKLRHPIQMLLSLLKAVGETIVIEKLQPQFDALIERFPYSAHFISRIKDFPAINSRYVAKLTGNAGSGDFGTANRFAKNIDEIEEPLSEFMTNESAFRIVAGVVKAANMNAFNAIDMKNAKFASIPKIRQAAIKFIGENEVLATEIVASIFGGMETVASIRAILLPAD